MCGNTHRHDAEASGGRSCCRAQATDGGEAGVGAPGERDRDAGMIDYNFVLTIIFATIAVLALVAMGFSL